MTDFAAIDLETANGQRSSVCIESIIVVEEASLSAYSIV